MDLSPAQREALTQAVMLQRAQVRQRVEQYVVASWNGLGSWRDADIARLVDRVVPVVLAGQRTVANLTDAYLASVTNAERAAIVDLEAGLRGVDPAEVYQRPAVAMRTELKNGASMTDALKVGATRIASLAMTDLQMAQRAQARATIAGSSVEQYRRVLTGRENCALCVVASTQRYHKADLLPIHPGCDCGIEPFVTNTPKVQVIDRGLLEATHKAIDARLGGYDRGARDLGRGKVVQRNGIDQFADYTDLLIVHEHGEYGPTLAWRGEHFDGPSVAA